MLTFLLENFLLGLKNLRLHKLRSLLTALGIIFGVTAVIAMVAIGEGSKQSALEQMKQLGANNVVLRSIPPPESSDSSGRTNRVLSYGLLRTDVERIREIPGLIRVVPLKDTEQDVILGAVRHNVNAIATTPEIFPVINLRLSRGSYFTQQHYDELAPVAVLGGEAARLMFPFQDPLGQLVQIGRPSGGTMIVTVIGVLEPTGLRAGSDQQGIILRDIDLDIYIPLSAARQTFGDTSVRRRAGGIERKEVQISEIWLQAQSMDIVEQVAAIAENVVMIGRTNLNEVTIKAPIQILRNAEQINRIFNFVLVGIASFSLIVGGIGIMNIMLASVTERTREIGIRRALGAKKRHVTLQFLIETTVISLTGGLIGIALGVGLATLLPVAVEMLSGGVYPTAVATWSVVGSFMVSGMIGIIFGMYPAIRAANMNPIEALRHE